MIQKATISIQTNRITKYLHDFREWFINKIKPLEIRVAVKREDSLTLEDKDFEASGYKARLSSKIDDEIDRLTSTLDKENFPFTIENTVDSLFRALLRLHYLSLEEQIDFADKEFGADGLDEYAIKKHLRDHYPEYANRAIALAEQAAKNVTDAFPTREL